MDCKIQKCLYSTNCNAPEMKCIFSGFTPGPPPLLWLLFHRLSFFLCCYAKGSSKFCSSIFCLSAAVQCVCVCATVCTSASGVLTKAVTYDSTNKNLHVPSGLPLSFSTSNIHLHFQIEAPLITSLLLK